jgi:hypothetical protein
VTAVDDDADRLLAGIVVGTVLALVLTAVLIPLRSDLAPADAGLALVLAVVAGAATGGARAGGVVAVVTALQLDFSFTQPYGHLAIAAKHDLATVALYLVVGVAVGVTSSRRWRLVTTGADRLVAIRTVHGVAERWARGATADELGPLVEGAVRTVLSLRTCRFEAIPVGGDRLARILPGGALETPASRFKVGRAGRFLLPDDGVELAVLGRGAELGRLVCEPEPGVGVPLELRRAAVALADVLGAALVDQGSNR